MQLVELAVIAVAVENTVDGTVLWPAEVLCKVLGWALQLEALEFGMEGNRASGFLDDVGIADGTGKVVFDKVSILEDIP